LADVERLARVNFVVLSLPVNTTFIHLLFHVACPVTVHKSCGHLQKHFEFRTGFSQFHKGKRPGDVDASGSVKWLFKVLLASAVNNEV